MRQRAKSFCITIFVVSVVVLFSGCVGTGVKSQSPADRFVMTTAHDGQMYRTNTQTGEVWRVSDNQMVRVNESSSNVLEVGKKYFIEGHRSVKYLGDGRLSQPVDDFSQLWN